MRSSASRDPLQEYFGESVGETGLQEKKKALLNSLRSIQNTGEQVIQERVAAYFDYFSEQFARADVLAATYQSRYRLASVAIYSLSAFAVMAISAQYIFHLPHLVGALEIAAMIIILVIIFWGNRVGWHRRWLDYRFLAERLRYGLNVAIAVEKRTSDAEKSLACRWVGDSWCLRYYQDIWHQRPQSRRLADSALKPLKDHLDATWIEDQIQFHRKKKKAAATKHERISQAAELFFWLTLVAACLHLIPTLVHLGYPAYQLPHQQVINSLLTYLAIVFPTVAAALTGVRAHFDYKKIADRSAMMENNLIALQERLRSCRSISAVQELAVEAESLMIQENSDWYVTVRLHALEAA